MATFWIGYNFQIQKRIVSTETIWGNTVNGPWSTLEAYLQLAHDKAKIPKKSQNQNFSLD